jgi:hypothetical protein
MKKDIPAGTIVLEILLDGPSPAAFSARAEKLSAVQKEKL